MSKRATMGDMKAETNGKTSFIAIDDIGDLLRGQAARMGSLHRAIRTFRNTTYTRLLQSVI